MPLNHVAPVFETALSFHGGKDEGAGGFGQDDGKGEEGAEGGGEGKPAEKACDGLVRGDGGGDAVATEGSAAEELKTSLAWAMRTKAGGMPPSKTCRARKRRKALTHQYSVAATG